MRAQVEQQAAATRSLFAPPLTNAGPEAVEMRFVLRDASQIAAREQVAYGHEIAVPATVVKRGEQPAAGERDVGERVGVGGAQRDRLIDDHMLAGLERAPREVEVRVVRCRDHDAVDLVERQQRVEIGDRFRVRIVGQCALGLAGRDGRDTRATAVLDYRRMKGRSSEPVTHQSNF